MWSVALCCLSEWLTVWDAMGQVEKSHSSIKWMNERHRTPLCPLLPSHKHTHPTRILWWVAKSKGKLISEAFIYTQNGQGWREEISHCPIAAAACLTSINDRQTWRRMMQCKQKCLKNRLNYPESQRWRFIIRSATEKTSSPDWDNEVR